MWACCGPNRPCSARWPPIPPSPASSRHLASAGPKALAAIRTARAHVREHVWKLAGQAAPDAGGQVIVDIDGVLVLAHSEKQDAAATWKKTFGHHPLIAFVDHGRGGSGEPVAALLRPGNAGSNTAADHITTAQLALAQLPKKYRRGRQTLIRTDSAGGTHEFVAWLTQRGRWLSYSVGMTITDPIHHAVLKIPKRAWTPAYDADGTSASAPSPSRRSSLTFLPTTVMPIPRLRHGTCWPPATLPVSRPDSPSVSSLR